MLGSGIAAVTAPFGPRPGAGGHNTNPARGAAEAPLDNIGPNTGSITGSADAGTGAPSPAQPAPGADAIRGLAVSQSTETAAPGGLGADETSPDAAPNRRGAGETSPDGGDAQKASSDGLNTAERAVVRQMAERDREVHQHEQAHARAGGTQAGSPSFTYQIGPDGKRYAVSGEVPIDTAPVPDDPQATIAKMSVVIAAALAPASPSMPDRRIAAQAQSTRLAALAELGASRSSGTGETDDDPKLTGQLFTHLARPEPGGELSRAV